jgi:tetratricopeptide (TPR) repeat protein
LKRLLGILLAVGGIAGAVLPVGVAPAQAQAQQSANTDLQKQYDAAFQEMLRQPANLDVLFKFATLASQTGDLEGSISALERMLLIDPNLPRVRLELGVLYYRLGSYEVARTYLEIALKAPNLPPDVRERAQKFMAEIQNKASPSHFSGEVFAGWRYQSNANLGPSTSSVRLFGQAANLNQQSVGQPDWGFVTSAQVRHTYDFGRQDKSALETQLTGYMNRQFQVNAANVSLLDLTSGPRFQAFSGTFEDLTLKPFMGVGMIWVNDTPYYSSYGAGVESSVLLTNQMRNTTTLLFRRHNNPDTWYLPTNSLFSGTEYTGTSNFQYLLTNLVTVFFNAVGSRFETEQNPPQNYWLGGVGGGLQIRFTDPLFKTNLPWTITLSYTYQWWQYDQPDPTVDPSVARQELDSIGNLVFSIPFDERTTFSLSGGRFVRSSNLPNYAFDNNSIMFGVGWRF